MLIYFPVQHSGCVNSGGRFLSNCPGFWQDQSASTEDAKRFYNCFGLRLPQERGVFLTRLPGWHCQLTMWGCAACFPNADIVLTCVQTTTHTTSCCFVDSDSTSFAIADLISCSSFVPFYDLSVRITFTFHKLQTETGSYWTALFSPSGYHLIPVQQSVWATLTDFFHLVFEIWPSFCTS